MRSTLPHDKALKLAKGNSVLCLGKMQGHPEAKKSRNMLCFPCDPDILRLVSVVEHFFQHLFSCEHDTHCISPSRLRHKSTLYIGHMLLRAFPYQTINFNISNCPTDTQNYLESMLEWKNSQDTQQWICSEGFGK